MFATINRIAELETMLQQLKDRAEELVGSVADDEEAVADSVAKTTEIYKRLSQSSGLVPTNDPTVAKERKALVERNVEAKLEADIAEVRDKMSERASQWQLRPMFKYHVYTGFGKVLATCRVTVKDDERGYLAIGSSGWIGLWSTKPRTGTGADSAQSSVSLLSFTALSDQYEVTCAARMAVVPQGEDGHFYCGTQEGHGFYVVVAIMEDMSLLLTVQHESRVSIEPALFILSGPNETAAPAVMVDGQGDVFVVGARGQTLTQCSLSSIVPVASRRTPRKARPNSMSISVTSEAQETVRQETVTIPVQEKSRESTLGQLPPVTILCVAVTSSSRCLFLGSDVGDVFKVEFLQPKAPGGALPVPSAIHAHPTVFTRVAGASWSTSTLPPLQSSSTIDDRFTLDGVRALAVHGEYVIVIGGDGGARVLTMSNAMTLRRYDLPLGIVDTFVCGATSDSLALVTLHAGGSINVLSIPLPEADQETADVEEPGDLLSASGTLLAAPTDASTSEIAEASSVGDAEGGQSTEMFGVHLFKSGLMGEPRGLQWSPEERVVLAWADDEFTVWDFSPLSSTLLSKHHRQFTRSDTLQALSPDLNMARAASRARSGTTSMRNIARGSLQKGDLERKASLPSGFNPLQASRTLSSSKSDLSLQATAKSPLSGSQSQLDIQAAKFVDGD